MSSLTTLSVAQVPWRRITRVYGNVLESAWKKACLELFKILSWHLPRGKTTKALSQDSRSPGQYLNLGPPEWEAGLRSTRPKC